jgi:hypothetical protein
VIYARILTTSVVLSAAASGVVAQVQPMRPTQPIQSTQPLGEWRAENGLTPDTSESVECRSLARQPAVQAQSHRPPQSLASGANAGSDEERRYELEAQLYDQCMRNKGFTR